MPPQSNNSSPGVNYWYGSNSLPDALEGLPQDSPNNPRMMRRASEAVVQAASFPRYVCGPPLILLCVISFYLPMDLLFRMLLASSPLDDRLALWSWSALSVPRPPTR
ncbi:hypothetical protein M3J09_005766 [Ascochyta lentis]